MLHFMTQFVAYSTLRLYCTKNVSFQNHKLQLSSEHPSLCISCSKVNNEGKPIIKYIVYYNGYPIQLCSIQFRSGGGVGRGGGGHNWKMDKKKMYRNWQLFTS